MRWAFVENGVVTLVVEQEDEPTIYGKWYASDVAGPGWLFANGQFQPPVQETPAPLPNHISQFAFRTRVGDDLVAQMELAAMHDPAAPPAVQLAKAQKRAAMARCFAAQFIDLDLPELRAGFASVPPEDFARIFDAPVRDAERP